MAEQDADAERQARRRRRRRRRGVVGSAGAAGAVVVAVAIGFVSDRDRVPSPDALTAARTESARSAGFERTTAAGIQLRLHTTDQVPRSSDDPIEGDDLPARCVTTGLAQATAIGRAAVATAQTLLRAEVTDRPGMALSVSGVLEADPILTIVLQVPPEVTSVTLTARSASDTITPVDGLAALAVPAPDELAMAYSAFGTPTDVASLEAVSLALTRADGTTTTLAGADLGDALAPGVDPACRAMTPPVEPAYAETAPTLPTPGTQPQDPAAGEAEIRSVLLDAYAIGAAGDERRLRAIDDPTGVQQMIDAIRADPARALLEPVDLSLTGVVFARPDEAWFRYDLGLVGGVRYEQQLGRARLVDGRWTITRGTLCADWGKVGAECGP